MQAQVETASRSDYLGPPVAEPTPAPVPDQTAPPKRATPELAGRLESCAARRAAASAAMINLWLPGRRLPPRIHGGSRSACFSPVAPDTI